MIEILDQWYVLAISVQLKSISHMIFTETNQKIQKIASSFTISYESGQAIKDVLEGLLKVKRIDMLIMFLERKQQEGTVWQTTREFHTVSHM